MVWFNCSIHDWKSKHKKEPLVYRIVYIYSKQLTWTGTVLTMSCCRRSQWKILFWCAFNHWFIDQCTHCLSYSYRTCQLRHKHRCARGEEEGYLKTESNRWIESDCLIYRFSSGKPYIWQSASIHHLYYLLLSPVILTLSEISKIKLPKMRFLAKHNYPEAIFDEGVFCVQKSLPCRTDFRPKTISQRRFRAKLPKMRKWREGQMSLSLIVTSHIATIYYRLASVQYPDILG